MDDQILIPYFAGQKLYMVRPVNTAAAEAEMLNNGIITFEAGVRGDLSDHLNFEDIYNEVCEANVSARETHRRSISKQLHLLLHGAQPDDLVIAHFQKSDRIAIGSFLAGISQDTDDKPARAVRWLRADITLPDLAPDLRFSMGASQKFFEISRNDAVRRAHVIINTRKDPGDMLAQDTLPEDQDVLEKLLRLRLHRRLGTVMAGHGMANVVAEILRLKGYQLKISPPGPDGGIDIMAGTGPMGFNDPLVVQVKSGDQKADAEVLQRLEGAMRSHAAEQGLLVSWNGFTKDAAARQNDLWFGIRFWDAQTILDEFIAHYDELPGYLRDALPLRQVLI
jgi:restriction system protein